MRTETFQPDSIVRSIVQRFLDRAKFGFKKYQTNLDRKDLTPAQWLQHLQDELHDAYLYSEKLSQEMSKKERLIELSLKMIDRTVDYKELREYRELKLWYEEQKRA